MRAFKWILVILLSSGAAYAQNSYEGDEIDQPIQADGSEITEYNQKKKSKKGRAVQVRNRQVIQPQQQQPTTYVEAAPLVRTRADEMRERRQQAESFTEQKIVERLEQARMEDEKRRAERLFGNRFSDPQTQAPVVTAPAAAPAPVLAPAPVVVAPVKPVYVKESDEDDRLEEMKNEIITSLEDMKPKKLNQPSYYMSAHVGMADYVDVTNVDSNSAVGFSIGREDDSGLAVEGSFTYSNFYVDEGYWRYGSPVFQEMDQYNVSIGAKYSPFVGKLRPNVGGLISYVHRKYGEFYSNYSGNYETGNNASSKSFDMGLIVGMDLDLTDSFSIGVDYKYMFNITSKTNSPYLGDRYVNVGTPIEELNYQMISLSAKARF